MKTILVSVDLSPATVHVSAAAADLASATGGRLVILHAAPSFPNVIYGFDGFSAVQVDSYNRAARKVTAHKLQALQRWFKKRNPGTTMALHDGSPAEVILKTARRLRAEYIVIGSHGHGAMYDLVAGSTTREVLRKSPCPVVLVPITKQTGKARSTTARPAVLEMAWALD
jgi:nucleotide-binding universal stress UspA family protein